MKEGECNSKKYYTREWIISKFKLKYNFANRRPIRKP